MKLNQVEKPIMAKARMINTASSSAARESTSMKNKRTSSMPIAVPVSAQDRNQEKEKPSGFSTSYHLASSLLES